jgi:hypothetical protein
MLRRSQARLDVHRVLSRKGFFDGRMFRLRLQIGIVRDNASDRFGGRLESRFNGAICQRERLACVFLRQGILLYQGILLCHYIIYIGISASCFFWRG